MNVSLLALWFVCALGSAVFATLTDLTRRRAVTCAVAYGLAALWTNQVFVPSVAALGFAAAAMAVTLVARKPSALAAWAMAGVLAGFWTGALTAQGLPAGAAIVLAPIVPGTAAWLRRRDPRFAPPQLREEALLVVVALGVLAAALPGVSDGWRAAFSLNIQGSSPEANAPAVPVWTLALASAALASGGLFSVWSRR